MYDPVLMRLTSNDPVRGKYNAPLTMHRYLYCINDPLNRIDPTGRNAIARILVDRAHRRPYLANQGRTYEALNAAGGVTALEAMATLTDLAAGYYSHKGADRTGFVEDLLWMFTERRGPYMGRVSDNLGLQFDDTGFRGCYRDGGNQVRHFIGSMGAGYYFGEWGGRAAVMYNELSQDFTWPDVWLGFEGVNFGTAINFWGYYRLDLDNVDDWMRDRLGE